jgi:penicillin amidase
LLPSMTKISPQSADARTAIERLRHWDARMDAAKAEPLFFIAWLRQFARSVFFSRLGDDAAAEYWNLKPLVIAKILTDRQDWCADRQHPAQVTCDARLLSSLDAALAELREDYGPDLANWKWGEAHVAEFASPFWQRVPLAGRWFRVGTPVDGGPDTVSVGPVSPRNSRQPFEQVFGAGLRIITDLARPADSWMIAAPGQSGNPLSPHFADLLQRWRDHRYLVPGRAEPVATLTLEPSR